MEKLQATFLIPAAIVWGFAGPITYILCVVDTWHWRASAPFKLLINLTVDVFAAAVWPGTWIFWLIQVAVGHVHSTPLGLLF